MSKNMKRISVYSIKKFLMQSYRYAVKFEIIRTNLIVEFYLKYINEIDLYVESGWNDINNESPSY